MTSDRSEHSRRNIALAADDRFASPRDGALCDLDIRASDLENEPPKRRGWRRHLVHLFGWWPDE